jgi:probable rRNA maturation factor
MEVIVQFEYVDTFPLNESLVSDAFSRIAADFECMVGAISLVFCSDEFILKVNQDFLEHDYYTDIITFDYSEDGVLSGDLIISIETVKSNSVLYESAYIDELFRVVIHGFLHLCGLGDKSLDEIATMRERESFYMSSCLNPFVSRETN